MLDHSAARRAALDPQDGAAAARAALDARRSGVPLAPGWFRVPDAVAADLVGDGVAVVAVATRSDACTAPIETQSVPSEPRAPLYSLATVHDEVVMNTEERRGELRAQRELTERYLEAIRTRAYFLSTAIPPGALDDLVANTDEQGKRNAIAQVAAQARSRGFYAVARRLERGRPLTSGPDDLTREMHGVDEDAWRQEQGRPFPAPDEPWRLRFTESAADLVIVRPDVSGGRALYHGVSQHYTDAPRDAPHTTPVVPWARGLYASSVPAAVQVVGDDGRAWWASQVRGVITAYDALLADGRVFRMLAVRVDETVSGGGRRGPAPLGRATAYAVAQWRPLAPDERSGFAGASASFSVASAAAVAVFRRCCPLLGWRVQRNYTNFLPTADKPCVGIRMPVAFATFRAGDTVRVAPLPLSHCQSGRRYGRDYRGASIVWRSVDERLEFDRSGHEGAPQLLSGPDPAVYAPELDHFATTPISGWVAEQKAVPYAAPLAYSIERRDNRIRAVVEPCPEGAAHAVLVARLGAVVRARVPSFAVSQASAGATARVLSETPDLDPAIVFHGPDPEPGSDEPPGVVDVVYPGMRVPDPARSDFAANAAVNAAERRAFMSLVRLADAIRPAFAEFPPRFASKE